MYESFDCFGWWWIVGNTQENLAGTLSFSSENGGVLKVLGSFEETELHPGFPSYALVHGTAADGKMLTLVGCQVTEVQHSVPVGHPVTTLVVRHVLVGRHLEEEDLTFYGATATYDGLDDWAGFGTLKEQHRGSDAWSIEYSKPSMISVQYPEQKGRGIQVTLESSLRINQSRHSVRAQERIILGLNVSSSLYLPSLLTLLTAVQAFFELGARAVFVPDSVHLFSRPRSKDPTDFVDLFERQPEPGRRWEISDLDMLFRYKDIGARYPLLLHAWISELDHLENAIELYRDIAYETGTPVFRFLLLVFALESYHRTNINANRSLRERFEEIRSAVGDAAAEYIGCDAAFMERVVTTRNFYAHQDPKLRPKALREEEMRVPLEQLRFLLEFCMMRRVGFAEEELVPCLGGSRIGRAVFRAVHGQDWEGPGSGGSVPR